MAQVTETKTFALQGWPGGLNTDDFEHLRQADEADLSDFRFGPRGEAEVRKGLGVLASHDTWWTPDPRERLGPLFAYTPDAGVNKFLIAVDTFGGVWQTATGPAPTSATAGLQLDACVTGSGAVWFDHYTIIPEATVLGSYFILVADGKDVVYWNGVDATWSIIHDNVLDDSGTEAVWEFPQVSTVCSGFSRLWAAGNATFPSRLYWSGALGTVKEGTAVAAGPWSWPALNWVEVNPEDGDEITKVVPYGQSILIFKRNSLYALVGAGDPASARLYPIHPNIGCSYPGTVAETAGGVLWASSDGVYLYDGDTVRRIDVKVRAALLALLAGSFGLYANAYALGDLYHLNVPVSPHGVAEAYHYVYDTRTERWEVHTDGGWGSAVHEDQPYVTRWGGMFTVDGHDGYDDMCSAAGVWSVQTVPAVLRTAWLPPVDQRTGTQYRIRRFTMHLDRPSIEPLTSSYRISLFSDFDSVFPVESFLLDLPPVGAQPGPFTAQFPGWAGLADVFRLTVEAAPTVADDEGTGRLRVNGISFILSERPAKRGSLLAAGVSRDLPAATVYDLTPYLAPLKSKTGYYLEGVNSIDPSAPVRSVLWFEHAGDSFKMYNGAPEALGARSHWDDYEWADGLLRYQGTTALGVTPTTKVVYTPGLVYLPAVWDGGLWQFTSTSAATYYEDDILIKTGTNTYTTTLFPPTGEGERLAFHMRIDESTYWGPGDTTLWREDFFYGALDGWKSLLRSYGGNLAAYPVDNWDVAYGPWAELPVVEPVAAALPMTFPQVTATGD